MLYRASTFYAAPQEKWTDRLEIEIGDSKSEVFQPQMKLMRWQNEVNFSIRADPHPQAVHYFDGDKIKYVRPDGVEVHLYEKPGAFEFEWLLPKRPKSNVLTCTIRTKGLDLFYQPPLTREQVLSGVRRPDNVIGSYAAYHKTKANNCVGCMEYGSGKAFHIYRPQAFDLGGNKVWCDLHIDSEFLTVTVPQEFLDTASYPVIVDPTFGYTTIGGTSGQQYLTAQYAYPNFALSEAATTLDSMTLYANADDTGNHNAQAGVYTVASPRVKVAVTGSFTLTPTAGWRSGNILTPPSASAATYALCIQADYTYIAFWDTGVGNSEYVDVTFGTWPGTYTPTDLGESRKYSLYVTYTAGGGGGGNSLFYVKA